jgi:hypothetical protein
MWMYPGPSYPIRSLFLGSIKILAQARSFLRGGIISLSVSLLELTFACLCQFLLLQLIHILMQGLGCAPSAPRGVTLPEVEARWEANRAENERQQARRQRR